MDKRVIFAVAGSGNTTYIVKALSTDKRSLIVTYTNNNYDNLSRKILKRFNGIWPQNITLMTYFQFLFRFCYKPFLADKIGAKGIVFEANTSRHFTKKDKGYYLTPNGYFYSNRLSLYLEVAEVISDIKERIETYFDEFVIDEIQDVAGRDFSFLELLMETNVNMLFVGDFYQHTYDTSRDGNVNKALFNNRALYEDRFVQKGLVCDTTTLQNSWRCSKNICNFVSTNLGIPINTNRSDNTFIRFVSDESEIAHILENDAIIKSHLQNSAKFGKGRKNWGETKGEDHYQDVCVMLNKGTMGKYNAGKLSELVPSTRNRLYGAITRAHGNVNLLSE